VLRKIREAVQSDLDRFLALVCRELGADGVRLLEADQEVAEDPAMIHCIMADGRAISAQFSDAPPDRDLKQRRLEMLVTTFDAVVHDPSQPRRSRPSVESSLHSELSTLCERAAALNTIVIDANSPVEWAAARPQAVIPLGPRASAPSGGRDADEIRKRDLDVAAASRRALHTVRGLSELAALRKGKHIRYVEREGEPPLIAHSFAQIYLLVVVFAGPFDELRAERAILDALPRIERLVLALPPLDPSPHAGVMAMRRPRRRG
jgi:hypothetical protein